MELQATIIKDRLGLHRALVSLREQNRSLALVPTMGALHEGHLSLVRLAKSRCDEVMASIFVNPLQFGPKEDFARYPRNPAEDIAALEREGVSLVYAPEAGEMYPENFSTIVSVKGVSEGLEGAYRPGFFEGVATVVLKLLNQTMPDIAVFGEKDYQQLLVVRQLVRDLDLPVQIVGAPIVREKDGLAMSSRNRYLSAEERKAATRLFATLISLAQRIAMNRQNMQEDLEWGRKTLLEAGFTKIDYLEARAAVTLGPLQQPDQPARLLAAAWLGNTRLIDNVSVGKA